MSKPMLIMINPRTGDVVNVAGIGATPAELREVFVDYVREGWRPVGERSRTAAASVIVADFARSLA